MENKYKSTNENFQEALTEARSMNAKDIKIALRQRLALHSWAIAAYEQALFEKSIIMRKKNAHS